MIEGKDFFILDDVLSVDESLYLYHNLLSTDSWTLSRTSLKTDKQNLMQFSSFPGMIIESNELVHNDFYSGYFRALTFRLKSILRKEFGVRLPSKFKRINLAAKQSTSTTNFHVDSKEENAWTILGFLNPVWDSKDGGQFYLKDKKINFKTGRFIIFRSNIPHDGGFVSNADLNNWRMTLNIILLDQ